MSKNSSNDFARAFQLLMAIVMTLLLGATICVASMALRPFVLIIIVYSLICLWIIILVWRWWKNHGHLDL